MFCQVILLHSNFSSTSWWVLQPEIDGESVITCVWLSIYLVLFAVAYMLLCAPLLGIFFRRRTQTERRNTSVVLRRYWQVGPLSTVADGPARRAASRASCSTYRWMVSEINCPPTVASVANFVRPTTIQFITLGVQLCRAKQTTCCNDGRYVVAKFLKSKVQNLNFCRYSNL